jgi:uncharacterized membrane protein
LPSSDVAQPSTAQNDDCQVNLKAELEIRHRHERIDHQISKQWERLIEIQALRIELMQERR